MSKKKTWLSEKKTWLSENESLNESKWLQNVKMSENLNTIQPRLSSTSTQNSWLHSWLLEEKAESARVVRAAGRRSARHRPPRYPSAGRCANYLVWSIEVSGSWRSAAGTRVAFGEDPKFLFWDSWSLLSIILFDQFWIFNWILMWQTLLKIVLRLSLVQENGRWAGQEQSAELVTSN